MWRKFAAPVVVMGIPIFIFPYFFRLDKPHGLSMSPTIATSGEVILCLRYLTSSPSVGDIVVARSPVEPQKTVMKRVRAVGGNVVRIDPTDSEYFQFEMKKMFERFDKDNIQRSSPKLNAIPNDSIDSDPKDSENSIASKVTEPLRSDVPERDVMIPHGQIWIEGDNPEHSTDSRHYGPIPIALAEARAAYCIWPFSQFRKL